MKLTYGELRDLWPALEELSSQPLYVSASLKVRRARAALRPEWQHFTSEYREIIERYAERDDDGELVMGEEPGTVNLEDPDGADEEASALLSEEIEVEVEPVPVEDLDKTDEVEISARSLDLLLDHGVLVDSAEDHALNDDGG